MSQPNSVHLTNEQILTAAPSVFAEAPHSEVSNNYGFLPTIQIVDGLREEGWFPVDATQKNVRDKSKKFLTKHLLRFRRLEDDIIIGDSAVELLLTNSHDRSCGFVLHAGIFRMACANGIVVADSTFNKVSVRHNKNARDAVIEGSYQVIDEVPLIANEVESMQQTILTPQEQHVFARTALEYLTPDPVPPKEGERKVEILTSSDDLVKQILQPKRSADTGSDLWSTYNVIQEKALRGGLRTAKRNKQGRYTRSTSREVKGIDRSVKLNKALWDMAMQMRDLKEAA